MESRAPGSSAAGPIKRLIIREKKPLRNVIKEGKTATEGIVITPILYYCIHEVHVLESGCGSLDWRPQGNISSIQDATRQPHPDPPLEM